MKTKAEEFPVYAEYVTEPVDFMPRECTSLELGRLVGLHDQMIAHPEKSGVDPQLVYPSRGPGEAGAAVAWVIFPLDPPFPKRSPRRVVVSFFCAGHTPGEPLAESIRLGRHVSARVFLDAEDGALWGEDPLHAQMEAAT